MSWALCVCFLFSFDFLLVFVAELQWQTNSIRSLMTLSFIDRSKQTIMTISIHHQHHLFSVYAPLLYIHSFYIYLNVAIVPHLMTLSRTIHVLCSESFENCHGLRMAIAFSSTCHVSLVNGWGVNGPQDQTPPHAGNGP